MSFEFSLAGLIESRKKSIEERWKSINNKSRNSLLQIRDILTTKGNPENINERASELKEKAKISICMSRFGAVGFLNDGFFKTNCECASGLIRIIDRLFGEGKYRAQAEKKLGIAPNKTKDDPPIVYGALYDEEIADTSWIYGKIKCLLKKENLKNRTSFTYGDSYGDNVSKGPIWSADYPMTWDEAIKARTIMNSLNENEKSYVEAQIMGGVKIEDVDEFVIPESELIRSLELREVIKKVSEKYPQIKFSITKD